MCVRQHNSTLLTLHLYSTAIGADGAKALVEALKVGSSKKSALQVLLPSDPCSFCVWHQSNTSLTQLTGIEPPSAELETLLKVCESRFSPLPSAGFHSMCAWRLDLTLAKREIKDCRKQAARTNRQRCDHHHHHRFWIRSVTRSAAAKCLAPRPCCCGSLSTLPTSSQITCVCDFL